MGCYSKDPVAVWKLCGEGWIGIIRLSWISCSRMVVNRQSTILRAVSFVVRVDSATW